LEKSKETKDAGSLVSGFNKGSDLLEGNLRAGGFKLFLPSGFVRFAPAQRATPRLDF
jgi:hypothetical protein